jgi:hypothetical protein
MVSVLAIGPKVRGLNPGRDDGFLEEIKIRGTPSFGGEVKPSAPYCKMLKNLAYHDRDTTSANFKDMSRQVSPSFATRCLCCNHSTDG